MRADNLLRFRAEMMRHLRNSIGFAALLLVASIGIPPLVGAQQTTRVHGTVVNADGKALTIRSRDGQEVRVVLAANADAIGLVPGASVVATVQQRPNGSREAIRVNVDR